ncbi:MAG: hypothetical protein H6869_09165 [Rhodospirillales bacterium]|nr:hypothetical protein [Rhodospirillales bacterium]
MFGFDAATVAGLLILAGNTMLCSVPAAPAISVVPTTAPVAYEFNLTSEELGRFKSNTVNPYDPGTDTATGGLRHDRPAIKTRVQWGIQQDPARQTACLWYDKIEVTIELSPKIYIASERTKDSVCRDAIIDHELKHVDVDRDVINKYAMDIGLAVKDAVDGAGAMGPYNYHQLDTVKKQLVGHITAAVESKKLLLHQEMARRQAGVDSLEEYERVSKICGGK